MSPPRHRKIVSEWPSIDQAAWRAANRPGTLFGDGGEAAHWGAVTRANAEKAYGLYLAHLEELGKLDAREPLEDRVTLERVVDYVRSLEGRLKQSSLANRVRDLLEAMRVMLPKKDHGALRSLVRKQQFLARRQDRVVPNIVSPSDLYEAGIGRMARVCSTTYEKRDVQAVQYADGLMMAMLSCKPIRRRNLHAMTIGIHLQKKGDIYIASFQAHETKTGQPVRVEFPIELSPWIDLWIDRFRTILLGGAENNAMWISGYRKRMGESTITARMASATKGELGVSISPHHVRHSLATGIAVAMPERSRIIPFLLNHKSEATSRKHYNLATSLAASGAYLDRLNARRKKSGKI